MSQLISCSGNEPKEHIVSEEDRRITVGSIPERFIHFGPALKQVTHINEDNSTHIKEIIRATVVFDSDDIPEYSGGKFSVRLFLVHHKDEKEKNDPARSIAKSLDGSFLYKKLEPYISIIGEEESYIGKNILEKTVYKSQSVSNNEYIITNDGDAIIFREQHSPKEFLHNGLYQYRTSINTQVEALYHIKLYSFEKFSHEKYFYAETFIKSYLHHAGEQ